MQQLVSILNFITIRLFNYAIFSNFQKEVINDKGNFITIHTKYCGYHKNYNNEDWRFNENSQRKNIIFINLSFNKFL